MLNAKIVMGAHWGDEGKGSVVAKLAQEKPGSVIVLCGAPQRGHTSSNGNFRHTFHHVGSGAHLGRRTIISKNFMINPMVLVKELDELWRNGWVHPEIFVEDAATVTFPQDMMYNQHLETSRGDGKHGSCGMGIWATQCRLDDGINVTLDMLRNTDRKGFDTMWGWIVNYYEGKGSFPMIDDPGIRDHFWDDVQETLKALVPADPFRIYDLIDDTLIFEMGQGIELDRHRTDNMPHISGSSVGIATPIMFLDRNSLRNKINMESYYVTRPYVTRHGAGPLEYECDRADLFGADDDTNVENEWQGALRYARICPDRLIKNVQLQHGYDMKKTLVITHVDETMGQVCTVYDGRDADRNVNSFARDIEGLVDEVMVSDSDSSLDPLRSVWS